MQLHNVVPKDRDEGKRLYDELHVYQLQNGSKRSNCDHVGRYDDVAVCRYTGGGRKEDGERRRSKRV